MNYSIKYSVFTLEKKPLKENGEIKVKNRKTRFEAQVGVEKYLEKKYKQPIILVIHSCEDNINDSLNIFKDIFGIKL